eukprot:1188560-Prorocentrum_minimum.AAC.2
MSLTCLGAAMFATQVLGDAVLNHRCASHQGPNGVWNKFGGKLDWDQRAIVNDDPNFQGRGNPSSGECFGAAPNVDHSQVYINNITSLYGSSCAKHPLNRYKHAEAGYHRCMHRTPLERSLTATCMKKTPRRRREYSPEHSVPYGTIYGTIVSRYVHDAT